MLWSEQPSGVDPHALARNAARLTLRSARASPRTRSRPRRRGVLAPPASASTATRPRAGRAVTLALPPRGADAPALAALATLIRMCLDRPDGIDEAQWRKSAQPALALYARLPVNVAALTALEVLLGLA